MTRGELAPVGATKVVQNGYHYTKTVDGWRLTHHVIAEKALGRAIDTKHERVIFVDKNRTNLDPGNLMVIPKKGVTKEARRARIESKIEDLKAELEGLEAS